MKHFKIVGPETTREFDIEDDKMLDFKIIEIQEYEMGVVGPLVFFPLNEKIYPTENKMKPIRVSGHTHKALFFGKRFCKECKEENK